MIVDFELRPAHEMPPPGFRISSDVHQAVLAVTQGGGQVAKIKVGDRRKDYLQRTAHNYASRVGVRISTSTDQEYLWIKFERKLGAAEVGRSKS